MKKNSLFSYIYLSSFFIAILILLSFLVVPLVSAQYTPPQPTPSSKFLIDKKIFNPQTQQYVDNLARDQYLFIPNQIVDFQLVITNTGNQDLYAIDITDQLPAELSYVSGGYINKGGQIYFYIDKLSPGQSLTYLIKAKVSINQDTIGIICPANLAQAQTGSLLDQDTSTFCIQHIINKQVPSVEQLPKTGLPLIAWSLAGLLPVGLRLRKIGSNNEHSTLSIWQKRAFNKDA